MESQNTKKIASNLIWRLLERFGAQGVTFVVSIILARILDPNVFGIVALLLVITTILQVLVESGFGTALVQKKDADDLDFSSVFYFNVVFCLSLYAILFFSAPLISNFYDAPELVDLIRILGLIIVISGFKNVQHAYVSRNLLYKKYFFATLAGTVSAAVVGIYMAYNGYGAWALVCQNVVNQAIDTIVLWFVVGWKPKMKFSATRLKTLFKFGWKVLVSNLIDTLWTQLRQLIIGKKYTKEDLAFYNKGNEYPQEAALVVNSSIDSVLFPSMSAVQDDKEKVKNITRRAISTSSYLIWPMMMGLAACAGPLVTLILTDKWSESVIYMQIFCVCYAFYPIHTEYLNEIKALGKSDIYLRLEIIKKVMALIIVLVSMWFGPLAMAISLIVSGLLSQLINSWPNKKLLGYSYFEQIKDIAPNALLAVAMGVLVYLITLFKLNPIITLLIQIPSGVLFYLSCSILFKLKAFDYCKRIIKSFKKNTNNDLENSKGEKV